MVSTWADPRGLGYAEAIASVTHLSSVLTNRSLAPWLRFP